jgi:hypothetical protein
MKLTQISKQLMKFFIDKKCINYSEKTVKTDNILKHLYTNISEGDNIAKSYQLKPQIQKILNDQIPRPKTFDNSAFPQEINTHINKYMFHTIVYTFSLNSKEITITFIVEEKPSVKMYNKYVQKIIVWLHIMYKYADPKCSPKLHLYIYFTSLTKMLPSNNTHTIGQNNVNTAFTYSCKQDAEIVIFRKEEWFKVLMHESFHNFGLDFSDMNNTECTKKILSIFKVDSDVNLFEAYTEFWAEIMNTAFCSYYVNSTWKEFLKNFEFFINFERTYKLFQMVKTLKFMGLQYTDLFSSQSVYKYKEESNVLSYYIITTILLDNYQDFLLWCSKNNEHIIQFKKSESNITNFCNFIETRYKTIPFLSEIKCMETFLFNLNASDFILNNMRMTICELG